jgi:aldehyde:ferredoxin oxidoreductase
MQGQGLLFATSNRGACHMRGNMLGLEALGVPKLIDRLQVQGKAGYVILNQNGSSVQDSLVACKFANIAVADEYFARALSALTGITYPSGEMLRAGERIWTLERLYNLREGFTRADDTLPPRLLTEPATGNSAGEVSHLEPMLDEYYRARGWTHEGVPRPEKLAELGLAELAEGVL